MDVDGAQVFNTLLQFVQANALPEEKPLVAAERLLVAADRYGFQKIKQLKRTCPSAVLELLAKRLDRAYT
ncbi:hypothetical protein ZWY2020_031902 [Hordeum vulgare]|nr:hypothetical protein ZWY2020_031902 [Hordeum vulgare]